MKKFRCLSKEKINNLPKTPGLYAFKKGTRFLYIGKAANLRERVKNHLPNLSKRGEAGDEARPQRPQQPTYRDNLLINQVKKISYLKTDSEIEALILEANLIKKYQPKYNIIWRDDKNYFYIGVTREDFPRIFWTHQIKVESPKSKVKSQYIGPFVDGKALKQTLKVLRKVFPYRSCQLIPNRPCLWYHLNRCPAPCLLKSSKTPSLSSSGILEKIKKELKKNSQRNVRNLIKVIKKGKNPVLRNLKKEMKFFSKNQDFEEAAKIRDQINALEKVMAHAKIFEPQIIPERNWPEIQKTLKKILKTKKEVSRIEAYDVSNIQGQEATGSMISFINGKADKNFYRKFKIKINGKSNDILMLKECLNRRLKHKEWPYPDLILIDGGKAQLNAASQCLRFHFKQVKVMALAKKKNELFIEGQKEPILLKNLPKEIFDLILQLRDEAHRFAKKYHLKLREIDLREGF